jgi:hypothetical protein
MQKRAKTKVSKETLPKSLYSSFQQLSPQWLCVWRNPKVTWLMLRIWEMQ